MFTLIIEDKYGAIADEFTFDEGQFVLGRSRESDIILPSDNVSRAHARLFVEGGQCYIEDLGSANGVFVDGKRAVGKAALGSTAQVKVGDFYLHIEASDRVVQETSDEVHVRLHGKNLGVAGRTYNLSKRVNLIGRGRDSSTTIIDPSVSRVHAKISIEDDGTVRLEDLKSANGTFVDARRVTSSALADGDVIRIGNVEFKVEVPPKGAALDDSAEAGDATLAEAPDPNWMSQPHIEPKPAESAGGSWKWIAAVAVLGIAAMSVALFALSRSGDPPPAPAPAAVSAEGASTEPGEELPEPPTTPVAPAPEPTPQAVADAGAPAVAALPPRPAAERSGQSESDELKRGEGLLRARKWKEASETFAALRERDPLSSTYLAHFNQARLELDNEQAMADGKAQMASSHFAEAAKAFSSIEPGSVYLEEAQAAIRAIFAERDKLVSQADALCKKRQYKQCEALYVDALAIDPRDTLLSRKLERVRKKTR
jgi:pSer/pThr/pTyr-binding forkhead associated (FHA) protein